MLGIGTDLLSSSARLFDLHASEPITDGGAVEHVIALTGIGTLGVDTGFAASPLVSSYTATAGRYRLSTVGFVSCAADEERLCYAADGSFRGQYLQGADTYYSAPWHDPSASNTSGDPAYLGIAGAQIAYAGDHAKADIFGGVGGGVVLTNTTANQFHINNGVGAGIAAAAAGDTLRYQAIVAIEGANATGRIELRGNNNPSFAVTFNHDPAGMITSVNESWGAYRAGFHDMGIINGKRWWYLWADRKATANSWAQIGIGFGNIAAQPGKTYHVCELMVQKNPATPPTAVPVCAAAKTFAADTLHTNISDAGYVCLGLATARNMIVDGFITPPAIAIGTPYEPLETRIDLLPGSETVDRSGILPNSNDRFATRPWLSSGSNWTVNFGPALFVGKWERTNEALSNCASFTVTPVFSARPDLRPILGRQFVSFANLGSLTVDGCILLGESDTTTSNFEQVDIAFGGANSTMFHLGASTNVYARNCLVMGTSLHNTRARYQIQRDDTPDTHAYVGCFDVRTSSNGVVDLSGTRFERLARVSLNANAQSVQVSLNLDNTCYNMIWSDALYWARGTYNNVQASRRFHGRMTFINDLTLFQSRKQIQVDTGNGFVDFSASGLAITDLPHGYEAVKVGTWDFTTNTFTSAPDPTRSFRLRYFRGGSLNTPIMSRPGFEWHASPDYHLGYSRGPVSGEVYEVDTGTIKVRVTHDAGYWRSGPAWIVTGSVGAQGATGTHGDNSQVNRTDVTINGMTADDVLMVNNGQGPFHTGRTDWATTANVSGVTGVVNNRLIGIFDAIYNMYRTEHSKTLGSNETINQSLFITAYSPLRDGAGKGYGGWAYAAGANNTITFGPGVTTATPGGSFADTGNTGTIVGTTNHIQLPSLQEGTVLPSPGTLAGLLAPSAIHSSGQASPTLDPWTFQFPSTAAGILGWDPNATLTSARGSHDQWHTLVAELVSTYHREPDRRTTISATVAVGTAVFSGITASGFHPRYSGMDRNSAGVPYFRIEGIEILVNAPLTGLNRIFVLRGDNDETYLIDIS